MLNPSKTAVVLFNLGGPDSLDAVRPFLYNLFADPDLFTFPLASILRKPLAWAISTGREKMAQEAYASMGGRSPILPLTQSQAHALEAMLHQHGHPYKVHIAMRYWHPMTDTVVDNLIADGVEDVILLPLYPHYSNFTTGSSTKEFELVAKQKGLRARTHLVEPYYEHPTYLQALAEGIQETLYAKEWGCATSDVLFLFSAHSLPKAYAEKSGDPYPQHTMACIEALMATHFPNQRWERSYQSKIGRLPWLEPYTENAIEDIAARGEKNILMIPISFVSEHIETLYEIDQLYLPQAREAGIRWSHRVHALNSHPRFIEALAQLVQGKIPHTDTPQPVEEGLLCTTPS